MLRGTCFQVILHGGLRDLTANSMNGGVSPSKSFISIHRGILRQAPEVWEAADQQRSTASLPFSCKLNLFGYLLF